MFYCPVVPYKLFPKIAEEGHILNKVLRASQQRMFLLAQFCRDYEQFLSNNRRGWNWFDYVLDNGYYEDEMVSDDRLIELARIIRPYILVLPDNADAPRCLRIMRQTSGYASFYSWPYQSKEAFDQFLKVPELVHDVKYFGIPRRFAIQNPDARIFIAKLIKSVLPHARLHALGFADASLMELFLLKQSNLFEFVDSNAPIGRGQLGQHLGEPVKAEYKRPPFDPRTNFEGEGSDLNLYSKENLELVLQVLK